MHLTLAEGLAPLANLLADELSEVPPDPFTPQLVVIPGEGVRSWLTAQLAHRLGPGTDARTSEYAGGIVANVEFVFPSTLIGRALAGAVDNTAWDVGPLTWAIYDVLRAREGAAFGRPAELGVARALADQFDRYALHRSGMVLAWEAGHDVDVRGVALPAAHTWQPQLWRMLVDRIGVPSKARSLVEASGRLRDGELTPSLPGRVHVFGLTGMPAPHLNVLTALGVRTDVHILAPTPSFTLWQGLLPVAATLPDEVLLRGDDPTATKIRHPLNRTWSSAARESLLLLGAATLRSGGTGAHTSGGETYATTGTPPPVAVSLLERLQHDLRLDLPPPQAANQHEPDPRPLLGAHDTTVTWHRCHGAARQVEVLRDHLVHLLQERSDDGTFRYHPRDVVVLSPDLATAAPLLVAACAGDPDHGVPELPLRIADRSLRRDLPVLDAVGALLELLDGRFRAGDVLAFAEHPVVRRRFGLDGAELGRFASWVEATCIRWGLDHRSQHDFGLPADITAFSWRAGLDQLLLGSALPDSSCAQVGPGGVVPFPGVEGDQVLILGKLAEFLDRLAGAAAQLSRAATPQHWCQWLSEAVENLFAVPETEGWHLDVLRRLLDDVASDAAIGGVPVTHEVPALELARLITSRLDGTPSRARFGTGAITLSSLVAQRGVPHPVVCLLGLDASLDNGTLPNSDDLLMLTPCVGDRDPQREFRAVLLDALLAAQERLVICSTGHDLRTNTEVPPAVPLAELADLIDATVRVEPGPGGTPRRASDQLAIDHPRHGWSERNFLPGALGHPAPFSFDRGALAAARSRRLRSHDDHPPVLIDDRAPETWLLDDLVAALENPVRSFLRDRLGVSLPSEETAVDDLVPLTLDALGRWHLADDLLQTRLHAESWDDEQLAHWCAVRSARGAVPPLAFGDQAFAQATDEVEALLDAARRAGVALGTSPSTLPVDAGVRGGRVVGEVANVLDTTLLWITPSKLRGKPQLRCLLRLAALTCTATDQPWTAVLVGKNEASAPTSRWWHVRFASPDHARTALEMAVDLARRTRRGPVPALVETTFALHQHGRTRAEAAWSSQNSWGDAHDAWVRLAVGELDAEALWSLPPLDDEHGPEWGGSPARVERWATRLWSTLDGCIEVLDSHG